MKTKITINLDPQIILKAKEYAKLHHTNLSALIETYLNVLIAEKHQNITISPLVESLTGVVPDPRIDEKLAYRNYLSEKYLGIE